MDFYATLGPACAGQATLAGMAQAGITGMRLNLSHGALDAHAGWVEAARRAGISRLLIDLQGPELRTGALARPLALAEGQRVVLGEGGIGCPPQLAQAAAPGQALLLDDGRIRLQVQQARAGALVCVVQRGGTLASRKSIAAPGLDIWLPTLTQADRHNLALAAQYGVTGVMLPFVRTAEDIRTLRAALAQSGAGHVRIFAKIENMAGVRAAAQLAAEADELVIARGDLGNAMPLWELPRCQKQLAALCRSLGRPFMVVTQMLDSMCSRAVPTRAEVCDIYNAVLDGAASVMLTGETAAGQYPVQAAQYLVNTARTALADRGW